MNDANSIARLRAQFDAILDRIVHSSHRIDLKGATLRDKKKEK